MDVFDDSENGPDHDQDADDVHRDEMFTPGHGELSAVRVVFSHCAVEVYGDCDETCEEEDLDEEAACDNVCPSR